MTRVFRRGGADDGSGSGEDGGGGAGGSGEDLDLYAYAWLAGGSLRVAESAAVLLVERGTLSLGAARLRVVGEQLPEHPVELAVVAACPRSKPAREVIEAVRNSSEVDELARRLVSLGLLGRRRRRPTRAGRRRLADAVSAGRVPAYVLHGPGAPARGRPGPHGARPVPDGLGRTLIRLGRALDDDRGHGADGGSDGGGGGFGGGGGGGGD